MIHPSFQLLLVTGKAERQRGKVRNLTMEQVPEVEGVPQTEGNRFEYFWLEFNAQMIHSELENQ